MPAARVERRVEELWAAEVMPPDLTAELASQLEADLQAHNAETIKRTVDLTKRAEQLKRERYRWADKAMEGAVPADIAKEKQQLAAQLTACEAALADVANIQQDLMQTVASALRLLEACHEA